MKEIVCEHCSKKFDLEESLRQHQQAKHSHSFKENKKNVQKNLKKYILFGAIILALLLFAYTFYARAQRPSAYDDFARCLSEKGVVVYGNDFCQYTNKQLNYFGSAKKYLNYVKCSENEALCNEKGVKLTPTWEINGQMYQQVQTFERLAQLTGCKL